MVLFLFWEPNVYNKTIMISGETAIQKGHEQGGAIFLMDYTINWHTSIFFLWLKKKS